MLCISSSPKTWSARARERWTDQDEEKGPRVTHRRLGIDTLRLLWPVWWWNLSSLSMLERNVLRAKFNERHRWEKKSDEFTSLRLFRSYLTVVDSYSSSLLHWSVFSEGFFGTEIFPVNVADPRLTSFEFSRRESSFDESLLLDEARCPSMEVRRRRACLLMVWGKWW